MTVYADLFGLRLKRHKTYDCDRIVLVKIVHLTAEMVNNADRLNHLTFVEFLIMLATNSHR